MTIKPRKPVNHAGALPEHYEEDRLVLLPRDPNSLFAYWEISTPTHNRIRADWGEKIWGDSSPVLRIYKHRHSQQGVIESTTDIDLEREARDWYISVSDPDRFYHAELGWRHPGGGFSFVLGSNLVRTPRDGISDLIDDNWRLPDWKSRKLFRRISVYHLSSPELIRNSQK